MNSPVPAEAMTHMSRTLPATLPGGDELPTAWQIIGSYWHLFLLAFMVSFLLTPVMRWLALKLGIVDKPDLHRKAHREPTPYLGGLAIFLAFATAIIASYFTNTHSFSHDSRTVEFPMSILFGAAVITLVGLVDDIHHISPRVKIGGQLIAAAALASQTVNHQMLGMALVHKTTALVNLMIPQFPAMLPGSVAYMLGTCIIAALVVGGCNAMNLIDGLDGLAAGVTAISSLGFLFITLYIATHLNIDPVLGHGNPMADPARVVLCLAIFCAVMGFLPYNFNPANIFMGDAGSLLLGFLCISTILLFTHTDSSAPKFVAAGLIVFALPLADTTLAVVRRKMRGQPMSAPDRQHLHHQFQAVIQRLGVSQNTSVKLAVISMYFLSLLFAVLGCAMVFPQMRYSLLVFVMLFSFIIVTAYKAGHRYAMIARDQAAKKSTSPRKTPTG